MAYQVIISAEVFNAVNSIVLYLEAKWSKKVAENFLLTFYEKVEALSKHPTIGKRSNKNPTIRRILITKHNMLYYQINESNIELLNIFYTAQDPLKNKLD
jgi:plasmid stabilization system protein ParE